MKRVQLSAYEKRSNSFFVFFDSDDKISIQFISLLYVSIECCKEEHKHLGDVDRKVKCILTELNINRFSNHFGISFVRNIF